MIGTTWWIDIVLIVVIAVLARKVMVLTNENRKIRDIMRRLEGVGTPKRKDEEPEERGHGDAEGQS
jgi:hypothetical protein